MTSRIPPLLPASPPPMYNLDFSEDEIDENDNFGDYSTASLEPKNCYENNNEDYNIADLNCEPSLKPDLKSNLTNVNDFMKNSNYLRNESQSSCSDIHTDKFISQNFASRNQSCINDKATNVSNFEQFLSQSNSICNHLDISEDARREVIDPKSDTKHEVINPKNDIPENKLSVNSDKGAYISRNTTAHYEFKNDVGIDIQNVSSEPAKVHENAELKSTVKNYTVFSKSDENDTDIILNESAFMLEENTIGKEVRKSDEDFNNFSVYEIENIDRKIDKIEVENYSFEDSSDYETEENNINYKIENLFRENHSATIVDGRNQLPQQLTVKMTSEDEDCLFSSEIVCPTHMSESIKKTCDFPESLLSLDVVNMRKSEVQMKDDTFVTENNEHSNFIDTALFKSSENTNDHIDDDFCEFISPTTYDCSNIDDSSFPIDIDSVHQINDEAEFTSFSSSDTHTEIDSSENNHFNECWNDIFLYTREDPVEVNVNTLEGKVNSSSIWCKMKNVETSPALNYSWNDSEANKILLSTLCVDSRNILFGPRWNSEVPRFASNLGFSPLVPQKASTNNGDTLQTSLPSFVLASEMKQHSVSEISESSSRVPTTVPDVPDALFDWNNSGLINPLDTSC